MGKRMVRTKLLPMLVAVTLVTSISAGGAQAASYQGSSRTAGASSLAERLAHARAVTASSSLAPCTAPLFGSDKDCESTNPTVDRWVTFTGSAVTSCTYTQHVDWGDGTSSSNTFKDPTPGALNLIASHIYNPIVHATYTETVSSSVDSGTCNPVPTTVFHFTHLLSAVAPSLDGQSLGGLGVSKDCQIALLEDLGDDLGKGYESIARLRGLFDPPRQPGLLQLLVGVGAFALSTYLVIDFIRKCDEQPTSGLSPLPKAFAYGASHPGKLFKPSGTVPQIPQVTGIYGYQKDVLDYFSLTYADPGNDATGFGFVGMNGAGWAEENHPFSNPSYGIVGHDRIDYPFNLACGTAQEYKSYVEAWIYDSQGLRSDPVEVDLSCTT